jgi:hypothetical protein
MANQTHTVVWGDTLSELAVKYKTTVNELVRLNNIKDPDYIVVGQVLIVSGTAAATASNNSSKPIIKLFGLQAGTDRTLFVQWQWDKANTDHYIARWRYYTGDGVWFLGSESETKETHSTYSPPENALVASFIVKPIAKEKASGKGYEWTASWSTAVTHDFRNDPPKKPTEAPEVEVKDFNIIVTIDNLETDADKVVFQVIKDNVEPVIFSEKIKLVAVGGTGTKYVQFAPSAKLEAGHQYKVRYKLVKGEAESEWSPYSDNVETVPAASEGITEIRALSKTSIYLKWIPAEKCTGYEIQYATSKTLFDSSNTVQSLTLESAATYAEITGLEPGQEYFFRLRVTNLLGKSAWTEIKSIILGEPPEPPTTWSSTTTAIVGEPLNLYWVHNSVDGSSQTTAELELFIGDVKQVETINNSTDENEKDKTSVYEFSTSGYTEGTKLRWRVRTKGITDEYGDWSVQRTVDIYAPPTLVLKVTDYTGTDLETLTSLPIKVSATAGPNTQKPIAYNVSVISSESYETYDEIGNIKTVNKGEEVYARQFDISTPLNIELTAKELSLENNIAYTIRCSVTMNSGLTAEITSPEFTVAWEDIEYEPNASVEIYPDSLSAYIRPYYEDNRGDIIEGFLISVYRREFDGSFTELYKDIPNTKNTHVVDPHPSLDYARYRIVAKSESTGVIRYYDLPAIEVGEAAAIIQWDEAWSNFDVTDDGMLEERPWSGSMVKLPYNLDVSESLNPDVELVEYIGREHPTAYYGTQIGQTSSWSVDIEKDDKATLYALRRLARWMGNVYVREPSGSGYWAHVRINIPQTHAELTIPVSIDISRVEGGI